MSIARKSIYGYLICQLRWFTLFFIFLVSLLFFPNKLFFSRFISLHFLTRQYFYLFSLDRMNTIIGKISDKAMLCLTGLLKRVELIYVKRCEWAWVDEISSKEWTVLRRMSFSWAEDFENRREIISRVMKFSRSSSSVALKFFYPNPGNVLFFQDLIKITGLGGKTCDRNFVSLYVIIFWIVILLNESVLS